MWGLCVRRPVGQKGEFKSGSEGEGTRSVQGFGRDSVRPGEHVCVCVSTRWCAQVLMCSCVTSLFLSVNSWRCVFYFFAFVCGVLALYDVSVFALLFYYRNHFYCRICLLFSVGFSIAWLVCFAAVGYFLSLDVTLWFHCNACETPGLASYFMSLFVLQGLSHILAIDIADKHAWAGWPTFTLVSVFKAVLHPPHTPLLLFLLALETLAL